MSNSELLRTLGVPLIVDDLYSLDSETLAALQPLHVLIFLFKYVGTTDEAGGGQGVYDHSFPGFFARQVGGANPPLSFSPKILLTAALVSSLLARPGCE
jgi:hypothetical protein